MIKKWMEKIKSINEELPALMAGILPFGILCQITVVWFVKDKAGYSIGLWLGIFIAEAMAYHMAASISMSVELDEETAVKVMQKKNVFRYGMVTIALGLIMISGFANPLAAFLGVMGLKVAAYVQPCTKKILNKFWKISL